MTTLDKNGFGHRAGAETTRPDLLDQALDLTVLPGFSRIGYAVRARRWAEPAVGRLEGKRVLVTGASSGLGEEACAGFAAAGATVHMIVRDRARGTEALSRIRARLDEETARRLIIECCDVSDLGGVRDFAESFMARNPELDLLVHNAGVLAERRQHTADGVELTFATNVLGPFLLTGLLQPALLEAAPSRVITVCSGGIYAARLDANDLQLESVAFDGPRFYAHTKRAQIVLNRIWSRQFAAERISFHAMHPGWADTPGLRSSLPGFRRLMRPLLRDARQGADTIVWLGTAPELSPATGGFWHDRAPRREHRLPSTHESEADRLALWEACERLSARGGRCAEAVD